MKKKLPNIYKGIVKNTNQNQKQSLVSSSLQEKKEEISIEDELLQYINQGLSKNDAIKTVAKNRKLAKNEVYQIALTLNI